MHDKAPHALRDGSHNGDMHNADPDTSCGMMSFGVPGSPHEGEHHNVMHSRGESATTGTSHG